MLPLYFDSCARILDQRGYYCYNMTGSVREKEVNIHTYVRIMYVFQISVPVNSMSTLFSLDKGVLDYVMMNS